MPTAADIDLARPRCDGKRMIPNKTNPKQSAVHVLCVEPLQYQPESNMWLCTACANWVPATRIVARRNGWVSDAA